MGVLQTMWNIFIENKWRYAVGVRNTLIISLVGTIIGLGIGVICAIVRTIPEPISPWKRWILKFFKGLTNVYIQVFRGTPMIVQASVIFYGTKIMTGVQLNRMLAAFLIVSINTGAYMAEVVRGGINSIAKGQKEAASSIGMTHFQSMRYILMPQAIRNVLPAVGNEFVINIKDTSVLSVISIMELYFINRTITSSNFKNFETAFVACVIYLIMTLTVTFIIHKIEAKMNGPKEYSIVENQMQV